MVKVKTKANIVIFFVCYNLFNLHFIFLLIMRIDTLEYLKI